MKPWSERAAKLLGALRKQKPMIHHLTNDVVTNFTANVTLCLGAAPVMATCIREVEDMVGFAGALVLNIGTLDDQLVQSMILAGKRANALGVPVVLDPVGAGATRLRTEAAERLLKEVRIAVLRGNAGEVFTLMGVGGKVRGVDSLEGIGERDEAVREFVKSRNLTVAVTGPVDMITDGDRVLRVKNGHPMLTRVTGTGCAATTAVAAFLAVGRDDPTVAAACALAAFGLAAEHAVKRSRGPGTFVPELLDSLAALEEKALRQGVRIE